MYITRLRLTNLRCFSDFEISFPSVGQLILLLGDNGDGKSTILRSLAMGLCDESSAAALFRELPGEYVRRAPAAGEASAGDFGTIEVDLDDGTGATFRIITRITSLTNFERVTQLNRHTSLTRVLKGKRRKLNQDSFPWERIFVAAYGAGLRTTGSADYQHYLPVDAVYSLFAYDSPLQNPELVIRRLVDTAGLSQRSKRKTVMLKRKHAASRLKEIEKLFNHVLGLSHKQELFLTKTGIKVKGRWGIAELGELGDGYQATITWVLDLLGWWLLNESDESLQRADWLPSDISGIVLIDEIEQHLHPRWQRTILTTLRTSFPKIQFIATTHSPLVASSCSDIPVYQLRDGGYSSIHPFGWLAEDVYSEMGLPDTRSAEFSTILQRFQALDRKRIAGKVSDDEVAEVQKIRRALTKLPESDPVTLTTELENLTRQIKSLTGKDVSK